MCLESLNSYDRIKVNFTHKFSSFRNTSFFMAGTKCLCLNKSDKPSIGSSKIKKTIGQGRLI